MSHGQDTTARLVKLCLWAVIPFAGAPKLAVAQWVTFSDETGTRLSLTSVSINDGEEKDIAVGDLDKDGWTDVVVVRKRPFSNPGARQDLLLMNENGVLVDRTADLAPGFISNLTDSRDVFIGDFTGDTWPDVVIANTFGEQPKFYRNLATDGEGIWLGLADESSSRFPTINVPGDVSVLQFCALWGGDVTGNGALDIYFANYKSFGGTTDVLFINDGTGVFTNETVARLDDLANVAFGTSVEIHDMDMDGDNDIVKISTLYGVPPFNGTWMGVLFNDGTGVFKNLPPLEFPNASPYMFSIGHLNDDDMLDVYNEGDAQDKILITTSVTQDSNVSFAVSEPAPSPRTGGFGGNTKFADVDGDGDLDVGVAPIDVDIANCGSSADFALLRNNGDGALSDPWPASGDQNFHLSPHDFAFLDVNQDGCVDIFMGLCMGWRVFINSDCSPLPPLAPIVEAIGSRYLEVTSQIDSQPVALLLNGDAEDPGVTCLSLYVQADGTLDSTPVFQTPAQWDTVFVSGAEILPSTTYEIRTERGGLLSPQVAATTWKWGDTDDNGVVNLADAFAIVLAFQGNLGQIALETADVEPCIPNGVVNLADVQAAVLRFQGNDIAVIGCNAPCS